jgi:hypothetical protein
MVMIAHQTVGSNPDLPHDAGLLDEFNKHLVIFKPVKYLFSTPAPVHHMVPGTFIYNS